MAAELSCDVLVVGAGPTGLMLANWLVKLGVRVIVVVLNNGVLGFQINAEESRFGTHTDVCHFGPIDHVAIARACGCDGIAVDSVPQLSSALDRALSSPVPFVIDVSTDPTAFPPLTAFESQLVALEAA